MVADEAEKLEERLSAGRFFVACVGQFKRGKSTVLNALVGQNVLPVGVTPVTSVVTILRHGVERRARVFYAAGVGEDISIEQVPLFVAEEHNPENRKGIAVVEIFLPAPVLASGLCLVDTPGIGSTFAGNTEATRKFVPHIDAALVVLGADPPISGDELALVLEVLTQVPSAVFALNKADRLSVDDVREAKAFTERLVSARLGRPIGTVLEISAAERIEKRQPTRDWQRLYDALMALAGESGKILQHTRRRGIARLAKELGDDFAERRGALLRPVDESEARISLLRRSVAEAEIMLRELGILLAAEQRQLLNAFQERQRAFLGPEDIAAREELERWIDRRDAADLRARAAAFEQASAIARARTEAWFRRLDPEAAELYRNATQRFTAIANGFLARLSESGDAAFASLPHSLDPEVGLRERPHFYQTDLMYLTSAGLGERITRLFMSHDAKLARIKRDAGRYLDRLLQTNTTRVVFDLQTRVEVSRTQLEAELRFLLQQITNAASRALERARAHHDAGAQAVAHELAQIDALSRRLEAVTVHAAFD